MQFLLAAGPPVWPVLVLSVAALVASIVHLRAGRAGRAGYRSLAIGLVAAALAAGLLGTVLGFQRSVAPLAEVAAESRWIFLLGLDESLNNLVVALVGALLVSLTLAFGSLQRTGRA